MELIPTVRLAAGLPPLVTPTSQIVGAQAVNCLALILKPETDVQQCFQSISKPSERGIWKTPVPVDPEFRRK